MESDRIDNDMQTGLEARFTQMQELTRQQPSLSRAQREQTLNALIMLLETESQALVDALNEDFGTRPEALSIMYDVMGSLASMKYARKSLKQWLRPSKRRAPFPFNLVGAGVRVEYQAKGVVGILGTWNVPVFTVFSPLAQVVAAGNRCIIKPSEIVPHTAAAVAELLPRYVDPDIVSAITGPREQSEVFSGLPWDHLVLTGGTEVGRAVMRAAAENLTPLTLELGGKSPAIVGRSAALAGVAEKAIFGKTINNGQICIAPDYMFVPREKMEEFKSLCQKMYQDTYEHSSAEATAIINERHCQRLALYLEEARGRGCQVTALDEVDELAPDHFPLHLVDSPPRDSRLGREEVFGPILILYPYDDIQEAIEWINAGERPLALYYFGKDKAEERRVLDNTVSGGVTINNVAQHPAADDAPFGGIGGSGMGAYHGREGFVEFSHARTIYSDGWIDLNRLMGTRPPFGKKLEGQLRKQLK